jgi:2-polyprenyl-3-methyl-5-hydroxy-6-metoxy-1,4-benzoquinol methylase
MTNKEHWEKLYSTRPLTEVSWYQPTPKVSLDFIRDFKISKNAAIIDVGGGDSYLADYLLDLGYTNITVLDISETAINRAKKRLGTKANYINWVICDITEFSPDRQFAFWHDRATFHFLTTQEQVNKYLAIANEAIAPSGKFVLGTFSEAGPEKCSGLMIKQYSETTLTELIKKWFQKIKCLHKDHITPFNTIQNFLYCSFKKITT